MSLATSSRPTAMVTLRRHPWILLWPITALLLTALTGVSPMGRSLPRLQAVGLTAAAWLVLGLILLLINWLTAGVATKDEEPVRRPWLALLAPLLPWLLSDMADGRISIPGLNWLGAGFAALLHSISAAVYEVVPLSVAPRISLAVQNGLIYILIPALLSMLFGVRLGARGLTWRSFWVGWVLAFPVILINVVQWLTQQGAFAEDLLLLATNPLINGYGEEFLYRGLIMPRLIQVTRSPALGISLSALFFGLIHYWANRPHFPDPWSTLTFCIIAQAPAGLLLGYLAYRLRSLLAGSILHVWMDT